MTTAQILQLARKKLLEEGTELLDDETLLIYANLTQVDIAKRSFPNSKIKPATITFTSGVGTLPADFGTLYGDPYVTETEIYPEVSINEFIREPHERCVTIENGTIKVFPTDTATIYIKYYPTYDEITSVTNPSIDSYLHELIIYGILYRAHEDLQDEQLSKYYRDKYETELTLKINAISMYEEGNQGGGQMFNHQQLI